MAKMHTIDVKVVIAVIKLVNPKQCTKFINAVFYFLPWYVCPVQNIKMFQVNYNA